LVKRNLRFSIRGELVEPCTETLAEATALTIRDRINRAEKKELIGSNDFFVEIRMVRNEIAHEYLPEAIHDIFGKVLQLTPALLDGVERSIAYCRKYTS
jgi:hypothetical protein